MKLSIDGRFRRAAQAAFVSGLAAAAFPAYSQDAAVVAPVVTAAPAEAAPQSAPADTAAPTPVAAEAPVVETIAVESASTTPPDAPAERSVTAIELKKITVTGSRLRSPNLQSVSPITTVGAAEIKYQGATRIEDVLNSLPQAVADQGGNASNGASGAATVNLRNLGSARTVVLIDGKRLVPGDPRDPAPDLNFIPGALVDRVDILTGGASAVYGADAVAGVVNFIMKRDFEGLRFDAQTSGYQHTNDSKIGDIVRKRGFETPKKNVFDGESVDMTAVLGVNSPDGKGNVTTYATYRTINAIDQGQRDYSACTLNNGPGGRNGNTLVCGGSLTSATGTFFTDDDRALTVDGTNFRDFDNVKDRFNFGPFNYYQRNDERYTLGAFAHYKFSDAFDVYTDVMFMDDKTNAVIAPSGLFFDPSINIAFANPLLSMQQRDTLFGPDTNTDPAVDSRTGTSERVDLGRRNVEGGGRDDDLRHTSYRMLLGVKGEVLNNFEYDVSGQYSTTGLNRIYRNDFSKVRVVRALDVVDDPATGAPTCQSVVDGTDPFCVPWNIFSAGGVTPQALSYLQTPGFIIGNTVEQILSASISGTLDDYGMQTPWAKEAVGLVLGTEYRREFSSFEPDVALGTGDLTGQGAPSPSIAGSFDVKEGYTELRLPVWQGLPYGEELSFELGYRYSDYSTGATTDTYKYGVNYAPVRDIKFRAGFNRAVRAPNVVELFAPQIVAIDGSTDPCAGDTPDATAAQCANDPVIAANPDLYGNIRANPAEQYNGLVGGSTELDPEKADTFTVGFVLTPTMIKNFSMSVDYYTIKVQDFIGGFGADTILASCYERGQLCDLIQRDPSNGSLFLGSTGFVVDTNQNTGSQKVNGVDLNINYRQRLSDLGLGDVGSVAFELVGSHVIELKTQPVPGDASSAYNCEGLFGTQCGAPFPNWRHKFRTTWQTPWYKSSISASWRYFGEVKADGLSVPNTLYKKVKAQNYFDLYASARLQEAYSFRVGINNIFDKAPPIVGSGTAGTNGNTYPQTYDALGRYMFAGVQMDF